MTPAKELCEAARLMREQAKAAALRGPLPWTHEPSAEGRLPVGEDVFDGNGQAVAIVRGSYLAEHITGMHPGVAVAVAEWLEEAVRDDGRHLTAWAMKRALGIARAYLVAGAAPVQRDAQGAQQ